MDFSNNIDSLLEMFHSADQDSRLLAGGILEKNFSVDTIGSTLLLLKKIPFSAWGASIPQIWMFLSDKCHSPDISTNLSYKEIFRILYLVHAPEHQILLVMEDYLAFLKSDLYEAGYIFVSDIDFKASIRKDFSFPTTEKVIIPNLNQTDGNQQ